MKPEHYSDFATEWISAWNSHDLESIMSHYSDQPEFSSPIIQQMGVNEEGIITSKAELRNYFERGLEKYPDLKFELLYVLKGVNSVVLFYKSINKMVTGEYMELNESGKVVRVKAHYAQQ